MKVLFDTNVLLDIALAREPFVKASIAAWTRSEADWILTRNQSDFKKSPVDCQTPEAFLSMFSK